MRGSAACYRPRMTSIVKRYPKDDFRIVWKPALCTHFAVCFRGLPAVFDPRRRPWITPESGDAEAILAQIERCPSGALSVERDAAASAPARDGAGVDSAGAGAEAAEVTRVEAVPDGPFRVHGTLLIRTSDGSCTLREGTTSLCRCGGSSNKPFCDGTHARNGFKG